MNIIRSLDTIDIIKKFRIENVDNSKYFHYFAADWADLPSREDIGWTEDHLEIQVDGGSVIGVVSYSINRNHVFIDNLQFALLPDCIGKQFSRCAFEILLKYLLDTRGFRKIYFSVICENIIMLNLIKKFHKVQLVGIRHEHYKLRDNKFYDSNLYEVFK